MRFLIPLLVIAVSSCSSHSATTAPPKMSSTPPVATVASAIEAKAAFDSAEALTRMLERRWPVAAIQAYSELEKEYDPEVPDVANFDGFWKGTLYPGVDTGFDKIAWYATTLNGRVQQFTLGGWRGQYFAVLEVGSEETVQRPPNLSPGEIHQLWF